MSRPTGDPIRLSKRASRGRSELLSSSLTPMMSLGRCQLAILAVLASAVAADPGFEMGLGRRQAPPAPDNVVYVTDANIWENPPT